MTWAQYLPQVPAAGGYLPYWMAFVSSLAVFNSVQNFVTVALSKKVYNGKSEQVSPLAARLFASWTLMSAAVRSYTAYDISNPALYNLSILSYVIVCLHFFSEVAIFRTAKLGKGVNAPIIVGSRAACCIALTTASSLIWMLVQKNYYLGL